ncbi:hypothetical protein MCOR25_007190 [Pyricularia grisea]|uniref:Biogenesis of lysosome-related organelles complex 1 subunit KXD1 n=1 Tax=Pyricularia grisea TaxID=148305 RepID=A0A6P8B658_PYRGI|nr:hypothetical protein PgNI_05555 [Pyricularia grisea]KAI6358997.1 hypothetical protein MCOR25_007190 [Pyricularia grisea]TLD10738.1 hypothetical protein PgNI_05555 [Pyricularia grisea]
MSTGYGNDYYSTGDYNGSMPMAVPAGKDHYSDHYGDYYSVGGNRSHGAYSVSPPESEAAGSSTTASGGLSYSTPSGYASSAYSSSAAYGGYDSYASSSQGDYDSAGSASGLDFNEYVQDRFDQVRDQSALDNCTVTQAKVSGGLNAKQRELLDLQKKAQARLAKSRARFADGMQSVYEVRDDLEWTQKTLSSIQSKASKKHPKQYKKARERYPSPDY